MPENINANCAASTGRAYCKSIVESSPRVFHNHKDAKSPNGFRDARFSNDGTTIITLNADACLRTFILPPGLLDSVTQPHNLTPYATLISPSPLYCYAIHPQYDLQNPASTLVLSASVDVPMRLTNALHHDTVHAKYNFINPYTEAYTRVHSVEFTSDGTGFVVGATDMFAVYDLHSKEPTMVHAQGTKAQLRKRNVGYPQKWNGIVASIAVRESSPLALGTLTGLVALHDHAGRGQATTVFSVDSHDGLKGRGVTDLEWSPCGTYLLIAERKSNVIQVYDVRNTFRKLSTLTGRQAHTSQRLGFDLIPTASGFEVWAGGTDGHVRMWANPGSKEGNHEPEHDLHLHSAPVTRPRWHPNGVVLATCSGVDDWQAHPSPLIDSENDTESSANTPLEEEEVVVEDLPYDNTLKIWTL